MNSAMLYFLIVVLCLVNLLAIYKVINQAIKSRTMVQNQRFIINQLQQVITLLCDKMETKQSANTESITINLNDPLAIDELLKQISK